MNRRDFVQLAILSGAASALAACGVEEENPVSIDSSATPILIVGAGISGLAAARSLRNEGIPSIILEARDRIGGRIWTSREWPDSPLDLGASWIHGPRGNPIAALADEFDADTVVANFEEMAIYDQNGRRLSDDEMEELEELAGEFAERIAEAQEEWDNDASLQQLVKQILADYEFEETAVANFLVNSNIEHEYGGDSESLSLYYFDQGEEFSGKDVIFPDGYDQIIDGLADGLDIRLNQIVKSIEYGDDGVTIQTNQGEFHAPQAILTVPLGVLKAKTIQFSPPLPAQKVTSIARLKMGVLNKTYLRFEEPFWDKDVDAIARITAVKGEWSEILNIYKYTKQPVLLGFNAATYGRYVNDLSDEETVAGMMDALRSLYGDDIPDPQASIITRWATDPYTLGSYSYIPVGASGADYDALAAPVADRLFFAGEATSRDYAATVHGAYLSGLRAAEELVEAM